MITTDVIGTKYDTLLDRDSAEEILKAKGDEAAAAAAAAKAEGDAQKAAAEQARLDAVAAKEAARAKLAEERLRNQQMREEERRQKEAEREAARARARSGQAVDDRQDDPVGGPRGGELGRPPDRQPVAARHFRRPAAWPLTGRSSPSSSRQWRDALFAKDEAALRAADPPASSSWSGSARPGRSRSASRIGWSPCRRWTSPASRCG